MTEVPLTAVVRYDADAATLAISGEIDLSTVETLQACVDAVDGRCRIIALDMADVSFMDSTGIRFLLRLRERFGPDFRELQVVNLSEPVRRVLDMSGVTQLLQLS